ncbi:MAG: murein biosynthesis integral membrane protein MurJ [Armatimonadetes bacterium]|nr:murein biosynthesis integral membrane protein MurJ [Candidatus Hippobium faecium]
MENTNKDNQSKTAKNNIAKAASLMVFAILLSRCLGMVREMIIAGQFGQGGAVSAYTAAFNLPDLLYFFLSSGALSSAFIPVFTEYFHSGRQKEAWQIFSIIGSLMGIVLTIIVVLAEIYCKPLVCAFAVPGFAAKNPDLVPLTVLLTRIILPCQVCFFMGGLMMGTLEARQNFKAAAAGPVIYNLGIIFGAVVIGKWTGISGLATGTLLGAFAGNICYTFYLLKKEGFEYHFSLNLKHPGVVKVGLLALPVIFGLSLPQIDVIINKWFASWISESAPAALNYANRVMQLPLGIFAQAAGTAILPTLSALAAKKAFGEMRGALSYGIRTVMIENIPSTIFMILMADPIIRVIYMSNRFTSGDVPVTSVALIFYSLGIFAWAGQSIVARGFFAMQDTVTPIIVGTISTVIFIPLNIIFMRIMGHAGLALSTTIAVTIHFIILTCLLKRKMNGLNGAEIIKSVSKTVLAALVMGCICIAVRYGCYRTLGTWQLQTGDIKSPNNLALKIMEQGDESPINRYLSAETIAGTKNFDRYTKEKSEIEKLIIGKINDYIMSGDDPEASKKECGNIFPVSLKTGQSIPKWLSDIMLGKEKTAELYKHREKGSIIYYTEDIIDIAGLINDITQGKSETAQNICSSLTPAEDNKIELFMASYENMQKLPASLQKDLNSFINNDRPDANSLENTKKKCREYIEYEYSEYVSPRPFLRVESKIGSLITVLIGLFACGLAYFGMLKLLKSEEIDEVVAGITRRFRKNKKA